MSSVLSTLSNLVSSTDTIQPITETKKWRWGIMGSGGICQDFSHAVRDCVPDAILQAIGARTLASAQKVKEQLGFVTAYGSFEEVAADPNVDVVYVGSVHNKHYEHAMLALKHNKPVLVEKAFMQNAKQAEEIFKVAKEKNLFVMEAYWTRFMPWTRKLRDILQSGQIGQVQHVTCDFSIQFDPAQAKRLFDPYLCGGALLDVGIYPTSIASMIYGGVPPLKVVAVGDLMETGVDGHIATTLRYGKNQTAQLFCGALVDGPSVLQIMGTKGRVTVHDSETGYWHCATEMSVSVRGADGKYDTQEIKFPKLKYNGYPHSKHKSTMRSTSFASFGDRPLTSVAALSARSALFRKFNYKNSEMLAYEASEVQRCLHGHKLESEHMTWAETLTIMQTLDEIRKQVGVVYPEEKGEKVP